MIIASNGGGVDWNQEKGIVNLDRPVAHALEINGSSEAGVARYGSFLNYYFFDVSIAHTINALGVI